MAHTSVVDEAHHIIETSLTGLVTAGEVVEIMRENVEIALQRDCFGWINDFSRARYDINAFEIYDFPKAFAELGERLGAERYRVRRAIVSSAIDDNQRFAQLIAANRGQALGLFDTLEEARAWLAERMGEIA